MNPTYPETTLVQCDCGWSRRIPTPENPSEALRYHRIQVHNDLEATRTGTRY